MERMERDLTARNRVGFLFALVCTTFSFSMFFMAMNNLWYEGSPPLDDNEVLDYEEFRGLGGPILQDHHQHSDVNEDVAIDVKKKVRVLCWVMTAPKNLDKKATAVKNTWGKRCNKVIFFSSVTNTSFPTVGLQVSEGREHLTGKTIQAFKYCYEHYRNQFDWFLKADDDTFIIVENLRYFLSHHSSKSLVFFGHKFKPIIKQGYFSGGAGYVLSRASLDKFVTEGSINPFICRQDGGAEDAELGRCMMKLGISAGESLDTFGKETFHPFVPIAHLEGHHPEWFYKYSAHKPQKGLGCCSDYSISFHYMSPSDMYLMDYLLYHLKPYGIVQQPGKNKHFDSDEGLPRS
ncbi:glycoprotein-N-acetylgalactosamine 3-beta-galactosyltransferase 1-like isoform X2 [Ostrea edulis]|uniref:glycoprotein-N-acetylgalactosamine 3-beta-galactosyltransferase 1-like isoform X2 n=1 Tax=Ostrea edulis TaxID=37623 RepID=UPI0024AF746C|nr:glycoprotein-N-acetylgalactosamine 3-beta-galactosyltransferase 1-like isoform X2 [Ostrea edulis]XP_056019150.1 glycoprotein-N-acetylgalactosamine 3-beta-galactosyltransferase 1-like isoform X2 [Ostrea edulis]XP_056019151.1 glycoprotein-N-acetylgalactosamine 3-beta-galactosyltransferase 1-like isoform X2 [Ostrea edulis]XP_056019152.1 glycoprotein-N-acetylgalactosamine 3-beta-galactosyltransferase 1-like isoform X2 [Ostrea edulis]XP_056019153.1 glycoprotein-N-acetylgalactosamine 3-beta-galact